MSSLIERDMIVSYLRAVAEYNYGLARKFDNPNDKETYWPVRANSLRANGGMAEQLAYDIESTYHLDPEKFRRLGVTKY